VVVSLYLAQAVLVPLALAVLFAFLLTPIVARLEALRLGRVASPLIVVFLSLLLLGSFGWFMEQRLADMASRLPEYRLSIAAKFHRITQTGGAVERVRNEIQHTVGIAAGMMEASATRPTIAASSSHPNLSSVSDSSSDHSLASPMTLPTATPDNPWPVRMYPESATPVELAVQFLGKIIPPFATAGLVVVLVIFMLLEREGLRDRMIYLIGYGRLHVTTEALSDAASRVSRFLMAQAIINSAFGTFVALGLWTIDITLGHGEGGLANAVLAGLLCAVLRFIPYVGTWIGAALPLAVSFAAFTGYSVFLATLAMFVVLEAGVSQAVEPKVLGKSAGISPLGVLVAAIFWTWLWGPIGLLLSTPLTVLLVVMGKYIPSLQFLNVMLGDRPLLDPPTRIYQRLIAGDDDEARDMALEYLKEKSLEEVYDQIIIPALASAEKDREREQFDEAHHAFLRQGFRDIVEALGEEYRTQEAKAPPAERNNASKSKVPESGNGESKVPELLPRPCLPKGAQVTVVCLPARTESDELVGLMLSQLLSPRGFTVHCTSAASLASELVEQIDQTRSQALVISALPPKAALHARYLVKRLCARYSDINLVVGLWTEPSGDGGRTEWGDSLPHPPATSLATAQDQLDQLAQVILVQNAATSPP